MCLREISNVEARAEDHLAGARLDSRMVLRNVDLPAPLGAGRAGQSVRRNSSRAREKASYRGTRSAR